ncbi:hypothetical protein [Streptosporangium saharense]|uniref:Uncharacterized protein n=1 Tax=Streptosporangium saharense TaxID=1706840 RepID=A0A7W7VNU8_9ACTN|nr:hypothetical protein [Streptosporangium saharense]MBB4916859.1 hypothetical protein [Streptosporangium saharense]
MSILEERYRRLLALYPAEHRARHGEEMLGVMLARAGRERRHPDPRDALDLVKGALLIRARHALGPGSGGSWRDALNVAAIVAPLHLLVLEMSTWAMALWVLDGTQPLFYAVTPLVFALPRLLIVWLALRGLRWAAAACAWTLVAASTTLSVVLLDMNAYPIAPLELAFYALPGVIVALLLTLVPDPAAGAELIGRRPLLRWTAVSVLTMNGVSILEHFLAPEYSLGSLALTTLVCMACGAASRTPVGRRAVALLVPLLLVVYGGVPWFGTPHDEWLPVLVQVLVGATAFVVARRGFRPYGSGTVSSPEPLA